MFDLSKTFLLLSVIGVALASKDDGQRIYDELFCVTDSRNNDLKPNEVLDRLEQLVTNRSSNSLNVEDLAASPENVKLMTDLLNVMKDQGCSENNIIKYNQLIRSLTIYGNIVKALWVYREDKYKRCTKTLYQALSSAIDSLDFTTRKRVMSLRFGVEIDRFLEAVPFYTNEALSQGVLRYLIQNPGSIKDKWIKEKNLSKTEITKLYEDQAESLCSDLSESLKGPIEFYRDHIANEIGLFRFSEGPAQMWTIYSSMCKDILVRKSEIIDDIVHLMEEPRKRRELFKCSGKDNELVRMFCSKKGRIDPEGDLDKLLINIQSRSSTQV